MKLSSGRIVFHWTVLLICGSTLCGCKDSSGPVQSQYPVIDALKTWTVGNSLEWEVDMELDDGWIFHFTGTERWLIESIDSNSASRSYHLLRASTGTMLSNTGQWNPPEQITGTVERFIVNEDASGLLKIPFSSSLLDTNFPNDTLIIKRSDLPDLHAQVSTSHSVPAPGFDTLRAISQPDLGLSEFYHCRRSTSGGYLFLYRYHFVLKALSPASQTGDYFPRSSIGDTSLWDFQQNYNFTMGMGTQWKGRMFWKVVAIQSTNSSRVTTIQRIFSGSWLTYPSYLLPDTGSIAADTSFFTMSEDNSHKITVDLRGKGAALEYYGVSFTFERFYPMSFGNEITLKPVFNVSSVLSKDVGMVKFSMWRPGMTGASASYTRLQ